MSDHEMSKEEQILRAVKMTITGVIKDTATQPGMKHPLSERTIDDLRHCLLLISAREKELADDAGRAMEMRPQMPGDAKPKGDVVIPLHQIGRSKKD